MTRKTTFVALFSLITCLSAPALADDVAGAAKAFSQGQQAMLANDAARAAEMYELADELAPSAAALRNAARARLAAGHAATAATLAAQLLQRYSNDKEARRVAEAILGELAPKLAQLEITCSEDCTLTLDGKAASASKPRTTHVLYAQPGARTLGATFAGDRDVSKQLTMRPGITTPVRLDAPPVAVPTPAPVVTAEPVVAAAPTVTSSATVVPVTPAKRSGIRRTWFVIGAVATVGLGAGATWQGLTTMATRDDISAATAAGDTALAAKLYDTGRSQQLRTNILIGATAAVGITTVVLALAADWSGGAERREVAFTPTAGGGVFVLGGRF